MITKQLANYYNIAITAALCNVVEPKCKDKINEESTYTINLRDKSKNYVGTKTNYCGTPTKN